MKTSLYHLLHVPKTSPLHRTRHFLLQLRAALEEAVGYLVDTRGLHVTPSKADQFCEDLVSFVSKLLMEQREKKAIRVGNDNNNEEEEEEEEQLSYRKRKNNHINKW